MDKYKEFYKARNLIEEILQKDFIGPVTEDEQIFEMPVQYYLMGKLYPQKSENEILNTATNSYLECENNGYDMGMSLCNVRDPSSIGITFTLKKGVTSFVAEVSFGWYELEDKTWKRKFERYNKIINIEDIRTCKIELGRKVQLYVYINRQFENNERIITATLLNSNVVEDGNAEEVSKKSVFQAKIQIKSLEEDKGIFTTVRKNIELQTDKEMKELEMLYSKNKCYAQGHGCSVEWDLKNEEPLWIKSAFFPSYELLQMKPQLFPGLQIFKMKYLTSGDGELIIKELYDFIELYKSWINSLKEKSELIDSAYIEVAHSNIEKCTLVYNQLKRTIIELEKSWKENGIVWRAFRLMNEAMFMQRKQTLKKNNKSFDEDDIAWYPFQLAFVLNEMISFIDEEGEERKKADLLWFPTGGGKTEAYLGISAFVIFLRRLRNKNDDGVTVIMRYTLRLLTIQQFERASMLICSCEFLKKKYNMGGSEISIGLWVGGKLTPNSLKETQRNLNKIKEGEELEESNPCQIKVCPWCGEKIWPKNYRVDNDKMRMIIKCSNKECETNKLLVDGLPMHIIDEAIYNNIPSFIVATVDKFAQMPLSLNPATLFGITNNKKPPELIIQDELHLISGPLGTMTGIYEAAVTKLCEYNGIPAKVVASTATVRNAENQILQLYGRGYTQFPPQGIDINDSFFAVISERKDKPSRKYFGVMGIGATPTTTLIRVNAAMLFATRYLEIEGYSEKVIDNYWTITGYFNSLRILGGAATQILDDVQARFFYLCDKKFKDVYPGVDGKKQYTNVQELTSRMNNSKINEVIQIGMKKSYKKDDKGYNENEVYSFILASNMLSVGVDVGRLGAMIVAGQPKTNSEYIQASSRVGRDNPGIVITAYNPTYSRDRSHYEQFLRYHSALYNYVEATSLTPFSDRARDRGLHALFVTLCRYLIDDLKNETDAVNFDINSEYVKRIEKIICDYVYKVDPKEIENVKRELTQIEEKWEEQTAGTLCYHKYNYDKNLLKPDIQDDRFRTMNSMRNVDAQAGIFLLGRSSQLNEDRN